jgi:tRNA dimethylallyltransferase
MKQPSIIFLMGPTACGKTALALELAQQLPVEIISVDSALVYREMDIGSAKPSLALRNAIPHHLIDICDPKTPYSVADFCHDAQLAIDDILSRGRIPLLVGGTMMYFNALKTGLSVLPAANPVFRAQIEQQAAQLGWPLLHQQLMQVDAESARMIHPHDAQRIARALEVYELTGKPLHSWQGQNKRICPYHICSLAVMPTDRQQLHDNINQRFDEMLAQGFINEVQQLFNRGDLSPDLPSMRAVGYRQAWRYLEGSDDFATFRENTLAATRQLAKRQVTWLRRWENLVWFTPLSSESVKEFLLIAICEKPL